MSYFPFQMILNFYSVLYTIIVMRTILMSTIKSCVPARKGNPPAFRCNSHTLCYLRNDRKLSKHNRLAFPPYNNKHLCNQTKSTHKQSTGRRCTRCAPGQDFRTAHKPDYQLVYSLQNQPELL